MVMCVILSQRPITYLYDYAIKFCTHRLKWCTQGHWRSEIKILFKLNQLYFCTCNFYLSLNNFRHNLNKLLFIASLWNHCWKCTILTSSSGYIFLLINVMTVPDCLYCVMFWHLGNRCFSLYILETSQWVLCLQWRHYTAFYQDLHWLLRLKQPSWTEIQQNL